MINGYRKFSNSWIAKALLVLIGISFVVAGGISATGISGNNIATVGNETISYKNFYREYKNRITQLGLTNLSNSELRSLQISKSVLDNIISRKTVFAQTKNLNLTISDNYIAKQIQDTEYFQVLDKFDNNAFRSVLNSNGYTEKSYIDLLKQDLTSTRYISTFDLIPFEPKNIAENLARSLMQTRSGFKASAVISRIKVPKPTKNNINSYFAVEKENFRKEEIRNVTVLLLSKNNLSKTVSNKLAKQYFQNNKKSFDTTEKRSFYTFGGTKEKLTKVKKAIQSGTKVKTAVKDILNIDIIDVFTNSSAKSGVEKHLKDAVFTTKYNNMSNVIDGPLGSLVVYIVKISPKKTKNFASVKNKIKLIIAEEKLFDTLTNAENLISEGVTLEETAELVGVKLHKINALPISGNKYLKYSQNPMFGEEIFKTDKGELTLTSELDNNVFFIARVDSITKSYIPELNNIRKSVENSYLNKIKIIKMKEILVKLSNSKNSNEFKKMAKRNGFKITHITNISRDNANSNKIDTLIFEGDIKSTKTTIVDNKGYALFIASSKKPVSVNADKLNSVKSDIITFSKESIITNITDILSDNFKADINEKLLNSVYQ